MQRSNLTLFLTRLESLRGQVIKFSLKITEKVDQIISSSRNFQKIIFVAPKRKLSIIDHRSLYLSELEERKQDIMMSTDSKSATMRPRYSSFKNKFIFQ